MIGRRRRRVACPQCATTAPPRARWCGACGAALRPDEEGPADEPAAAVDDGDATADPAPRGRLAAALLLVAVTVGAVAVRGTADPEAVPAGLAARGDGARSGVVSVEGVPAPTGVVWRTGVATPPLRSRGTRALEELPLPDGRVGVAVVAPVPDGLWRVTVHALDDGEAVWTTSLPLGSDPTVVDQHEELLVHRTLAAVTLLDLATGERRWTVEERLRDVTVVTPAGVVGRLVTEDEPTVVLLDVEDGDEAWRWVHEGGQRIADAWTGAGTVVLRLEDPGFAELGGDPGDGSTLVGLDLATGAERWRLSPNVLGPSRFPSARPVADGTALLVPSVEGPTLVDLATGATRPVELGLTAAGVALDGGTTLAHDGIGTVVARDGDGERWRLQQGGSPVLGVALSGDLAAVLGDSELQLLDATTGTVQRRLVVDPAVGPGTLTASGVVTSGADGTLALETATGTAWSVPTVAAPLPDLATDDGAVALSTPSGVEVLEAATGERRFAYDAYDAALVEAGDLTAPALLADTVLAAPPRTQPRERGGLLGLVARTGIVDWARDGDRVTPRGTPVPGRDVVLLPVGSQLFGYDLRNGARTLVVETGIARHDLAADGDWLVATDLLGDAGDVWVGRRSDRRMLYRAPIRSCTPPVIAGELVLLADHTGDLLARRLATGEQPWGERTGGSICRPMTLLGDHVVLLVDDRELLAVSLADGEPSWRAELDALAVAAPVAAGDQLLVPTAEGVLEAWELGADAPAWRVALGGVAAGSAAVDGDTVVVQLRDGTVVGVR